MDREKLWELFVGLSEEEQKMVERILQCFSSPEKTGQIAETLQENTGIKKDNTEVNTTLRDMFKEISFFDDIKEDILNALVNIELSEQDGPILKRSYSKDESILKQEGEPFDKVYIVTKGCIKLFFNYVDKRDVFAYHRGELLLGEMEVFDSDEALISRVTAKVVNEGGAEVYQIPRKTFHKLLEISCFAKWVLATTFKKMKERHVTILALAHPKPQQVVFALAILAKMHRSFGRFYDLSIPSQNEISLEFNLSTGIISGIFSELMKKDIVKGRGHHQYSVNCQNLKAYIEKEHDAFLSVFDNACPGCTLICSHK